ncbi:MAG: type III pantothenate kinase, partial [Bacteroidetes bacterium]|nr:type III pantothenate kinase [Bacteroidota bacterium]
MNLAIDIGNTKIKAGIFSGGALLANLSGPFVDADVFIKKILAGNKIENIILSSVVNHSDELFALLASNYNFVYLSNTTKLPFKNKYATPETLGNDRLSSIAGAYAAYHGQNVLVIDAGTCIKCDFISEAGEYLGGSISPGIQMRYNALHTFTQKLPNLNPVENQPSLIGDTT